MLKKILFTAMMLAQGLLSQSQVFEWVKPYENELCGNQKKHDSSGNHFVFTAGPGNPPHYGDELFLHKVSPANDTLWTIPQPILNYEQAIEADSAGNCYVAGTSDYYRDIIVSKYDPSGNLLWERRAERNFDYSFVFVEDIGLDDNGNVFLLGTLQGDFQLGDVNFKADPIFFPESLPEELHNDEIVLIKISSDGTPLWAEVPQGPSYNGGSALTTDNDGNVYIAGYSQGEISFDHIHLFNPGDDNTNSFVAKYNASGEVVWASPIQGQPYVSITALCGDDLNNLYIKGYGNAVLGDFEWYENNPFYAKISQGATTLTPIYRINAGGQEIADTPLNWAMDKQLSPVTYLDQTSSNHTTGTFTSWKRINNTGAPKDIFGTNRYDVPAGGELKYHFPVNPGRIYVNLFFAEKLADATDGQRVFDVMIENRLVLRNFDIAYEGGIDAVKKSFVINASDDMLDIHFIRNIGNPQVNGIEILVEGSSQAINAAIPSSSHHRARLSVASPASDQIHLTMDHAPEEASEICIFNSMGALVYKGMHVFVNGSVSIPASSFTEQATTGIYILKTGDLPAVKFFKE